MNPEILKLVLELNRLTLVANARDPVDRDEPWDWRQIEQKAEKLAELAAALPHLVAEAQVKLICPAHEIPARALGRALRFLREKNVVAI